jgi:hypothetical protein
VRGEFRAAEKFKAVEIFKTARALEAAKNQNNRGI